MSHRDHVREARAGLARVAAAERDFLDGHPYRLLHKFDPRAAAYTVRVAADQSLPPELPAMVAGVLRHAADALDALAAALSEPGRPGKSPRFPIHDSLPEFAQRSRRSLAGMPDEAQATIEALQPYHTFGGFHLDLLWLLRELNAAGAPRLAAGSLRDDSTLGVNTARHVEITGALQASNGAFEHEAVIATVTARVAGPDPKLDLFLTPSFELAFAESGPARGAALVATLGAICDRVEHDVIASLEPALRRG